jgi:hypothetical protein
MQFFASFSPSMSLAMQNFVQSNNLMTRIKHKYENRVQKNFNTGNGGLILKYLPQLQALEATCLLIKIVKNLTDETHEF